MSQHLKPSKQYGRRIFVALTFIAAAYLFIQFRGCMQEAQMSLEGASALADTTITTQIINRKVYEPPRDSVLTMAQIQFELDVLRALDSVDQRYGPTAEHIATLFNRHVRSASEYSWIRTITLCALRASIGNEEWSEMNVDAVHRRQLRSYLDTVALPTVSDSVLAANQVKLHMFIPTFALRAGVIATHRDVDIVATTDPTK